MSYQGKWLKAPETVLFSVQDAIARITLNRPEKRNAISPQMLQELHDACLEADDRTDVNVVILEGAGRDFSAGFDLGAAYGGKAHAGSASDVAYRSSNQTYDDDCWHLEREQELLRLLFKMHKPVIAKVHGNCLAGANDIALQCDFIIAADDARIGFPATRANGSPPNHMWVYHLGPQWAKRMLMTGDCVSGRDAAHLGLVLESAPASELDAIVNELARRIACVDAELLSAQKRVVNAALELMGAGTLQRFAAENDARAHLSKGPRRLQFKEDMAKNGLKTALANRDAPFGDGMIRVRRDD